MLQEYQRGLRWGGGSWYLRFDVQGGWGGGGGGLVQFGPIRTDKKREERVQKLDSFHGCHEFMVPNSNKNKLILLSFRFVSFRYQVIKTNA